MYLEKFMTLLKFLLIISTALSSTLTMSSEFDTKISIEDKGLATYYVTGQVNGYSKTDFMIDTGSGYSAINETMLEKLRDQNKVEYLNTISGVMANGNQTSLPVYLIASINIGGKCILNNIKAVVLPGNTRNILGLNALKKAAPFAMSVNPPKLILSHCQTETLAKKEHLNAT
jgi:clan AA aspartic protease (TIGR02281 family)